MERLMTTPKPRCGMCCEEPGTHYTKQGEPVCETCIAYIRLAIRSRAAGMSDEMMVDSLNRAFEWEYKIDWTPE